MKQINDFTKGILCVAGAFLLHFSLGTVYTFGNLSPYIASYLKYRTNDSWVTNGHMLWVFSSEVLFQGFTMSLGGVLDQKIGSRIVCLCGCWTMSIGTIATYFTVKQNLWLVMFTYGVVYGCGTGLTYSVAIATAMKWFPLKRGMMAGIVTAGFGLGSLVFNLIQTAYINPKNISPNISITSERYFTNDTVLSNVPLCFVLIGSIYAIIQLIGVILLTDPNARKENKQHFNRNLVKDEKIKTDESDLIQENNETKEILAVNCEDSIKSVGTYKEISECSLQDAIKDSRLWILSLTFFFNGIFIVVISSYYKSFGQTFISDDRYFSIVGSVAAIFNSMGRVVWGKLIDSFSYRKVMTALAISKSLSIGGFYFCIFIKTEVGAKIMFFIWVCWLFFCLSGSFALFPAITSQCFGNSNLAVIYGFIFLSYSLSGICGAIISSLIMDRFQYGGIFIMAVSSSLFSIILTQFFRRSLTDRK